MKQSEPGSASGQWRITLAPSVSGLFAVIALSWAFAGLALWLLDMADGGVGPVGYALILPFPLVVTWYGLNGIGRGNGRLDLERDGFWQTLDDGERRFVRWDRVEAFRTSVFGDPVVTGTGVEVAEFAWVDADDQRQVTRLANSLPYAAGKLARLLEHARREAGRGWPEPPADLAALARAAMRDDPDESGLRDRLSARPLDGASPEP